MENNFACYKSSGGLYVSDVRSYSTEISCETINYYVKEKFKLQVTSLPNNPKENHKIPLRHHDLFSIIRDDSLHLLIFSVLFFKDTLEIVFLRSHSSVTPAKLKRKAHSVTSRTAINLPKARNGHHFRSIMLR